MFQILKSKGLKGVFQYVWAAETFACFSGAFKERRLPATSLWQQVRKRGELELEHGEGRRPAMARRP